MASLYPGSCSNCPHRFDYYSWLSDHADTHIKTTVPEKAVIQNEILRILKECGITNKGYQLLITGLMFSVQNPMVLENLKKNLYPKIARIHHTTATRVERNIRTAIEKAWTYSEPIILERYFGNTVSPIKGKPTNLQFFIVLTEIIRESCSFPDPVR